MLTQTAEYALRAVLYLAGPAEGRMVPAEEVADALGIPESYLSKTLQTLAREGILLSTRGRTGGFQLAADPRRLTLVEVIAPFDATDGRRHCVLGRRRCGDAEPCAAHHAWKATADRIADFFRTTTVAALRSPIAQLAPLA